MTKVELKLSTDVQYLKGVGPRLASILGAKGIHTVEDLLNYFPRAYEDRRAARNIGTLKLADVVSLRAQVVKVSSFAMGRSRRRMWDILLRDHSGQIHCKFFRVPYKGYFERFQTGSEVRVIGKATAYGGRLEFHHPELRAIDEAEEIEDDLVPIYTEMDPLSSAKILRLVRSALSQLKENLGGEETFPIPLMQKYQLQTRAQAIRQMHEPPVAEAELFHQWKSPAQKRIIFEEFFWLELSLAAKKMGFKKELGISIQNRGQRVEQVKQGLPFQLTQAQVKAFRQIEEDLSRSEPMHRLVQGDVGSGKTLVAFLAVARVQESGYQSCFMVPTEILAEQHFRNSEKFLSPLGIRSALLTGKTKGAERKQILSDLESGKIDLLIGTHAILEDPVLFHNLALVIIDEQHRFGVEQRAKLKNKGASPHFLVMTATPIPRTLAMTVYGDLEVSIIDELPPGRSPIQTRVIYESKRLQALQFMADQVAHGRQAYVVYPLVEESEKIDLKNAMDEFATLQKQFPQIQMGLLHGRMKSEEKDQVMSQFRKGEVQVLVSTTVIEVGVDVPNANMMIIEHAERFGLSQLHQLRGRVGRGTHKSFCVLILGRAVSEEARLRTAQMEQTTDGFKIAEFDLELRGPGEFLGTRQAGLPGFVMANLVRDVKVLEEARKAAFDLLTSDPKLMNSENQNLRNHFLKSHGPAFLASIG